ncbi:MAG: response regulator transcription factor [Actinobacteria bacterium]|nr:response regulator transcription factor [Actinomycetota bacterium]
MNKTTFPAAPETTQVHILVVDDDENLRRLVAAYLETEGYNVTQAADGHLALAALKDTAVDLVVLDLMLPGFSGIEVARQIHAKQAIPILMLTARGSEEDMLEGFDAGTDDYLVKPFTPKVLVARVRAVLRRLGAEQSDEAAGALIVGDLSLNPRTREVLAGGHPIELTTTEFELLRVLTEHPGWVYSREELIESVWGYSYLGESRLVDAHVANLRKKFGDDPAEPRYLHTVRGAGYKFVPSRGRSA